MKVKCIKENSYVKWDTKLTEIVFAKGKEYNAELDGKNLFVINELGSKHVIKHGETRLHDFFETYFEYVKEVDSELAQSAIELNE